MPMEMGRNFEHTTERLTEGLRCPWKWGHCRLFLHVDFIRYLVDTYSVVSGLDWTGFSFWVISWIGLD